MDQDEFLFIQLRDCFYGGYSMPQYCIDVGIKRPLFVSFRADHLWELFVQFNYDKRLHPEFFLLNGKGGSVNFGVACVLGNLKFEPMIAPEQMKQFDRIIILSTRRIEPLFENAIYLNTLLWQFIKRVYAEKPLCSFMKRNPGVKCILTDVPELQNNKFPSDYEKRLQASDSIHELRERLENRNGKTIETRFDMFGYTNDQVRRILQLSDAKTNADGSTALLDDDDELVGIRDGFRRTADQPSEYDHSLWFMGTCTYFGIGAPYDKTFESFLQKLLNANGHRYRVVNAGQFFAGRYQDIFYNLNKLPVKAGDIVFICLQMLPADSIPFFSVKNIFNRPHNFGEVFSDSVGHLNENGYRALAHVFYGLLVQNKFFVDLKYNLPSFDEEFHAYGIPQFTPPQIIFRKQNAIENCERHESRARRLQKKSSARAIEDRKRRDELQSVYARARAFDQNRRRAG